MTSPDSQTALIAQLQAENRLLRQRLAQQRPADPPRPADPGATDPGATDPDTTEPGTNAAASHSESALAALVINIHQSAHSRDEIFVTALAGLAAMVDADRCMVLYRRTDNDELVLRHLWAAGADARDTACGQQRLPLS